MSKYLDSVYKNSVWIVITLSMIGYFAYKVMRFDGSLESTLTDWQSWVHMLFVVFLNVTMVSGAYDNATSMGILSLEFQSADDLNNKLIESYNNERDSFRKFVKALNEHELQSIREDYLFSIGDKKYEDLTEHELKAYNNLKPIQHNIYGFNLPLYYELSKNGKVSYQASIKKNEGKRSNQIKKFFIGLLFGSMTINMIFSWDNVGDAFISLLIISVGLIITFIMTWFPQVFKLRYELPKKVLLKNTLYNSYVEYKTGIHVLKKLTEDKHNEDIGDEEIKQPLIIEEAI